MIEKLISISHNARYEHLNPTDS